MQKAPRGSAGYCLRKKKKILLEGTKLLLELREGKTLPPHEKCRPSKKIE